MTESSGAAAAASDVDHVAAPPEELPRPDRPLGPDGLGMRVGPAVEQHGWRWMAVDAPAGLDGPPGVLQGGLAAGLAIDLAQASDRFGAPLHALTARLEAPTLLGVPIAARVRDGSTAGTYEVETWQRGLRRVRATVELTGGDPLLALGEHVALAGGPLPPPSADSRSHVCFVCGGLATHPLALHVPAAFVAPGRVSAPWIPDERLAGTGANDPVATLVVAAALDCVASWAAVSAARERGQPVVLLGTMRMRMAMGVSPLDPVRLTALLDTIEGRKFRARSAIVDTDGRVLGALDGLYIGVAAFPPAEDRIGEG